jgi:hypothetical protein
VTVSTPPLITRDVAVVIETYLSPYFKPEDRNLAGTLRRILIGYDVNRYDKEKAEKAVEEARGARYLLAALILSQSDKTLRVSQKAMRAIAPGTTILRHEDIQTGDYIYRVSE